jgi:uncharacterized protein (DUF362 family)
MSTVALVRCENYDYENVRRAVGKGMDLLGGPGRFAKKGRRYSSSPTGSSPILPRSSP